MKAEEFLEAQFITFEHKLTEAQKIAVVYAMKNYSNMKVNKESIKSGLFFTLFVCAMASSVYMISSKLDSHLSKNKKLDSLKMENIKLDIEIKKRKLQ
jgi:hypothetical protein